MKNRKKIFLKSVSQSTKKKRYHKILGLKKDIEIVQKLNIQLYPNEQSPELNKIKNKTIFVNKEEGKKEINKRNDNSEYNTLAYSIRKLKKFYPNIKDEVFNENYANGNIPSRAEHLKIEKNLKTKINKLSQKQEELKEKQEYLENDIKNLNKIMDDQLLSIEVIINVDNNTERLQKKFREKTIIEMKLDREKKINYFNTKEYQEKLNLFLLREDFTSKQRIKEINDSLDKNKIKKDEDLKQLNEINNELKNLNENKKKQIEYLYLHYLNILKEGKDTRNEGLSWIIREIFNLDKKVMISFFPKFLDKKCIQYLFDITHINMKITDTENQIKACKKDFKDKGLVKEYEKNENDILFQRKNAQEENLKKIKRHFSQSFNFNKNFVYNTISNNTPKKNRILQKLEKNKYTKNLGEISLNIIHKNSNSIKRIIINNDDKKNLDENHLPYINGDPNNIMKGKDQEVNFTNKLVKNEVEATFKIPPVIRLKDFDKLSIIKNCFTSNDIIKVNNFFSLKRKLSKLREEKDMLKNNEMDRIYKEFRRNNYGQKYNVDKNMVISALIGEDNINNELFRQQKRERNFINEISKSQMHTKTINYTTMNDNLNSNKFILITQS